MYTGKIRARERSMPQVFARFYTVGALLWLLSPTRGLFVAITSPSLLLTVAGAFLFHRGWNLRTVLWFAFIVVSAFCLEWAGVHDQRIFGRYAYGPGLAPLVDGTPLIIGLNWLWLVYASHDIAERLVRGTGFRILTGSILMTGYDLALEWAAPAMRMWHFDGAYAPVRNFAVWFAAAVVYHSGAEVLAIRSDNRPARILFGIQVLFFLAIGLLAQILPV